MSRRQDIIKLLSTQPMTLKELAEYFRLPAKDLLVDLQFIPRILSRGKFTTDPSVCKNCGYVFKDREKKTRPNKCPKCRYEKMTEPVFSITYGSKENNSHE